MGLASRIKNAWNAFNNRDPTKSTSVRYVYEPSFSDRPDRTPISPRTERSFINAFYNRIAIDVAQADIRHARVNEDGQYKNWMKTSLDECLHTEANIDQTGRALIQDIVMSMFDEGCCAVVPVDCKYDPTTTESYEILSLRVGKIVAWYPHYVKVNLYNEKTGNREDITLEKEMVAIIENPLYSVMNEPNSTIKRLVRKLNLLDAIDEQSNSQKLNMIIQLPYVIKSEARKNDAERRRKEIEDQLVNSKYGIAYTDGTEKITQIGRPLENNLLEQVKYLESMVHSQLGLTENILNGTASEQEMLNYNNRTIAPILMCIVEEFRRKFLTKTARSQGQSIIYYNNPFKLVPVNNIADIADKFTRNEIMSSNEMRAIIGLRPVEDMAADELRNKNLNQPDGMYTPPAVTTDENVPEGYEPPMPQEEMEEPVPEDDFGNMTLNEVFSPEDIEILKQNLQGGN